MTRAARPAIKLDVIVASGRWKEAGQAKSLVRRAVTLASEAMPSTAEMELAIVLSDDSAIRLLNRDWRGVDAATNVLSFPAAATKGQRHLGDVILAYETIVREATSENKPFAHHLAHLAVHGFLHLIGYDHVRDSEATAMERAERRILRQLGIPDPYRAEPRKTNAAAGTGKNARVAGGRRGPHPR